VLAGVGDGTLRTLTTVPVGQRPLSIAAADLDGDGVVDLAVADDLSDDVGVLLADGQRGFQPVQRFLVEGQPFSIVAANADHDGRPDLFVSSWSSTNVDVILGRGRGARPLLRSATSLALQAGATPVAATLMDVNGDGRLDLVVAYGQTPVPEVRLGDGSGNFGPGIPIGMSGQPVALASADVDGDGHAELLITSATSTGVEIWTFDRGGQVKDFNFIFAGDIPSAIAAVDIDGDGDVDVVLGRPGASLVALLRNDADILHFAVEIPTKIAPSAIALGDVDGDGHVDMVVAGPPGMGLSLLRGSGNGTLMGEVDLGITDGTIRGSGKNIALMDADGDGKLDLLIDSAASRDLSVFLGDGRGHFPTRRRFVAPFTQASPSALALGDVDGDGVTDAVMLGESGVAVLSGTTEYRCW
jgi:hypothetical protein